MRGNHWALRHIALLVASLFAGIATAEECTVIFPGGVQSHSPSGSINMGYMSRIRGGGSTLIAPAVTHQNNSASNPEHSGLCDNVKCVATKSHSAVWTPEFLKGNGKDGNVGSGGYEDADIERSEGDYNAVNVGQNSEVRFVTKGGVYRIKSFRTNYQSVVELQSGDYWVDGQLTLNNETIIRRASTAEGVVRIFTNGNASINWSVKFQGFSAGQLLIYSTGNIKFDSRVQVYAALYAANKVSLDYKAKLTGAISGAVVDIGQEAEVLYPGSSDLSPICGGTPPVQINHFEFVTNDGAHTCSPHTVTIKACTNATSRECQPYPGDVSVSLTSGGWVGGSSKTLVNGIGEFELQGLELEMPLGVASSSPISVNQTLCQIGSTARSANCLLSYTQSGFIIDVPDIVASEGAPNAVIRAVVDRGKEGSPQCGPAFTNESRVIKLWSDFVSPAGTELSESAKKILINGDEIAQNYTAASEVGLYFGEEGSSTLEVNYRESGKMRLNAYYEGSTDGGDSGLMVGSGDFVSRPDGFCIKQVPLEKSRCRTSAGTCQVGEIFEVTIKPVAWSGTADWCAGREVTRNYRQKSLELTPSLIAPSGPNAETGKVLVPGRVERIDSGETFSYDHVPPEGSAVGWNGEVSLAIAMTEVGRFGLTVTPPSLSYLDEPFEGSTSAELVRLYPTHVDVRGEARQAPSCGSFSYQDQLIKPESLPALSITGKGIDLTGTVYTTKNYDFDAVWGLVKPSVSWMARSNDRILDKHLIFEDDKVVSELDVARSDENSGDGQRTYTWKWNEMRYKRSASPSEADIPFDMKLRFSDLKGEDDVCYRDDGKGECLEYDLLVEHSNIRLGRVRSENIIVPSGNRGSIPVLLEHWNGSYWARRADNCTNLDLPAPASDELTYPDAGITIAELEDVSGWDQERLTLTVDEPATPYGRVWIKHFLTGPDNGEDDKPAIWLCQQRSETDAEAPLGGVCSYSDDVGQAEIRSSASFGIYRGPAPLIFRRELYRGM